MDEDDIGMEGGILAVDRSQSVDPAQSSKCLQQAFLKLRCDISSWIDDVLSDALAYALISGVGSPTKSTYDDVSAHARQREVETIFGSTIWPTLKNKGWTAALDTDATGSTTTMYSFQGLEV